MSSEVSICNQALSWLGANLIISLDDATVEGQLCKANYSLLRDAVIEEGKWTFATERFKLLPDTVSPVYGYSAKFRLPSTVFIVIEATVYNAATNNHQGAQGANGVSDLNWRREGDFIVCNESQIYCKCIVQVIDPKKFTRMFTQALAARIAFELAVPLTESKAKEKTMGVKYLSYIDSALAVDGQQGKSDRLRGRSLNKVR
jgi:hypothetical protein